MENMWDVRFASEDYIYGKKANSFLREKLGSYKPGKILFPGEGEGRNAVFAAISGWDVTAFDSSKVGKMKAEKLASEQQVSIDYRLESYESASFEAEFFDMIALIYAHSVNRQEVHQKMLGFLKPGGIVLLEGFSKEQIENNTGGPGRLDMLFSTNEILSDFKGLSEKEAWVEEVVLDEGDYHRGIASVLRFIGKK